MRAGIFSKGKKTRPILPQKAPGKASFHAKIHWETPGRMDDRIVGEFSCKGFDTFGPFKLIGGISKGHPDKNDLDNAKAFFKELEKGK